MDDSRRRFISACLYTYISSFCIIQLSRGKVFVSDVGHKVQTFERYYHLVSWGIPAFFLSIVALTGALGDAGNWCWIKKTHMAERFYAYYLPLILVFGINTYLFTRVSLAMHDMPKSDQRIIQKRILLYVGGFLFIRIWGVVNRFQNFVAPNKPVFILFLLQSIFSPLQGAFNSIIYGFNKRVVIAYQVSSVNYFKPLLH